MDVRMQLLDGIEATRAALRGVDNPAKILVITTFENDGFVHQALQRAGANCLLIKRSRRARDRECNSSCAIWALVNIGAIPGDMGERDRRLAASDEVARLYRALAADEPR
jgi:CheY-like chemotaxis protein